MDITKLKVVELRAELASRGLDQKGNKPVLIARLQEALDLDQQDNSEDTPQSDVKDDPGDDEVEEALGEKISTPDEASAQSVASSDHEGGRQEEDSSQFVSYQEESESKPGESEVNDDEIDQVAEESSEQPRFRDEESRESAVVAVDETSVQSGLGDESSSDVAAISQDPLESDSKEKSHAEFDQDSSSNFKEPESNDAWNQPESNSADAQPPSIHLEDSNAQDALDAEPTLRASEVEDSGDHIKNEPLEDAVQSEKEQNITDPATDVKKEVSDIKKEAKEATSTPSAPAEPRERRRNRWGDAPTVTDAEAALKESVKSEESQDKMDEDRGSRKRDRSPDSRNAFTQRRPDNEPYFDDKDVLLSWYDSDLHMVLDKDNYFSATLTNTDGFAYVWAGVRATYGFDKGKVYYEIKGTEQLNCSWLEDEPNPHALRVGWSINDSDLQLGEVPLSYGYGSTGKTSTNCKFQDYGKEFGKGDVVGCYLDLDSENAILSYTLNGEDLGTAFTINKEELKGKPLFPHILSKNYAFHVNFGEQEPWATPLPGYTFVGIVPLQDRVAGPRRPEKREDCEVIMMVGLPASGKTTWATKYVEENKEKKYNILGTNTLIEKMKVMGLPRRRNYSGRWEGLISKCTRCLNMLLEIAALRRRNYILDQTNVYPTAQKRKMRGFEGFVRRAVVIMPTDEELKARTAKREEEDGKDVPDSAVLEMKANYALPDKDSFDKIEFVELQEDEAAALVKQYNKEGNDAGYESKFQYGKRPRLDDRGDRQRSFSPRGGGFGGRGGRGGYDRGNRNGGYGDRSGGYNDRNRSGGYGGGGGGGGGGYRGDRSGGGGWRERGNSRPRNDDRGSWGGGRGGGSWRDNRGGGGGGGSGGGGGGWGGQGRYGGGKDDRRVAREERPSDKDNKRPMGQGGGNWNQQQGYQQQQGQNWNNYGNQWGAWGQGYNPQQGQQQWKGFGQQGWGQQAWGNQNWANWNQQYYNQAYQQGWGQQPQASATGTATDATQATGAGAAAPWPGYASVGATGYPMAGNAATQQGAATGNSYPQAQK